MAARDTKARAPESGEALSRAAEPDQAHLEQYRYTGAYPGVEHLGEPVPLAERKQLLVQELRDRIAAGDDYTPALDRDMFDFLSTSHVSESLEKFRARLYDRFDRPAAGLATGFAAWLNGTSRQEAAWQDAQRGRGPAKGTHRDPRSNPPKDGH